MALRSTWSGLTDDDILVLGKFLLAVNALDVAMENAIMRYWQIGDRSRFREVFFERIATGDKKRLLQKSLDDASHKDHFKAIDDAIEKRNIIAHRLPITEWVVDDWDKGGEALDVGRWQESGRCHDKPSQPRSMSCRQPSSTFRQAALG